MKSAFDASQLFRTSLCFAANQYIVQPKCRKKWIWSAVLGTRWYNF